MQIRLSVGTKLAVLGMGLAAMIACSSSSSGGAAASPEDAFCGALGDAYTKCASGSSNSCGATMTSECAKVAALLNPSVLSAATTCLQSQTCGQNPLGCLGSSLSTLTPTDAQSKLVDSYCGSCSVAPQDACKTAFFGAAGTPGVGVALLPFGDAPLAAVESACTSNPLGKTACQAAFSTCLTATTTKTLAATVSADAVTCLFDGIKDGLTRPPAGMDASTDPGGDAGCTGSACKPSPTPACGPDTCVGCCDATGQCQQGSALTACGAAGGACASCGTGKTCGGGQCLDESCQASCTSGCCTASGCQPGTNDSACGTGGGACTTCGAGRSCNAGACGLSGSSTWDVVLEAAQIPAKNASGGAWDAFNGLPDPFAKVVSGGASGSTPVISDTLSPAWSAIVLSAVSATSLKAQLQVHLFDSDVAFDDSIGVCDIAVNDATFDGALHTATCPASSASEVAYTLLYRIKAH